jgi:Aldo/keto reductase family
VRACDLSANRKKISNRSIYPSSFLEPPRGHARTTRRTTSPPTCPCAPSDSLYGKPTLLSQPISGKKKKKATPVSPHIASTSTHRYGIRAFDTSPYYDNSEIILGDALQALSREFPRRAYQLLTKVGRYGPTTADFDYSRDAVRRSVRRSLRRLHTPYLDVVYVHDIEFVATCVAPRAQGNHAAALGDEAAAYGLAELDELDDSSESGLAGEESAGDDERVLEAISALRELQAEGLIRHVGISGPSVPCPPSLVPSPSPSPPPPLLPLPLPLPLNPKFQTPTPNSNPNPQVYPSQPSSAPRSSCYAAQAVP